MSPNHQLDPDRFKRCAFALPSALRAPAAGQTETLCYCSANKLICASGISIYKDEQLAMDAIDQLQQAVSAWDRL